MSKVLKQLLREDEETATRRRPALRLVPPPPPPPHFALHFKPGKKGRIKSVKRSPVLKVFAAVLGAAGVAWILCQSEYRIREPVAAPPAPVKTAAPEKADPKPAPSAKAVVSQARPVDQDESLNREAVELFRKQQYDRALSVLMEVFNRHPKNPAVAVNIGMVLLKKGDLKNAREFLSKAERFVRAGRESAKSPRMAQIQNGFGAVAIAEKNLPQAQYHLRKAIDIHPEYMEARLNLARVLELAGRPEDAIVEYEEFLKREKVDPAIKPAIEKRLAKIKTFVGYLENAEDEVDYTY